MSEEEEAVVENRVPNTPAKEPANSRRLLLSALGVLGGAATLSGCLNAQEAQALETGQLSQSILLTGFSADFVADLVDLRLYVGKYDASTGYYTRENIYVFVGAHSWTGGPDGGEGWFVYDSGLVAADNDGTIIKPDDVSGAGRWRRVFDGSVNVKWFGAKGDYDAQSNPSSDDTLAIEKAFAFVLTRNAAASGDASKPGLYFPHGKYRVTSSALFSPTIFPPANGFRVHGEGWRASRLVLDAGADAWFYDNGVGTKTLFFMQFENLAFLGSGETSHGFRLWSNGHEQGFRFTGCWFGNMGRVIQVDGTANAAENQFINCRISMIYDAVWVFNNPQSVANEFHSTDVTNVFGDFIRIESGGGGSFRMFGGTLVFRDPQSYVETWLVNVQADSLKLGGANNDFLFYGTKHEMHGDKTGLVYRPAGQNVSVRVVFDAANFATTTGSSVRTAVDIQPGDRVTFNRCSLPWQFTYAIGENGSASTILGENGTIDFIDCQAPDRLSEKIAFAGASGQARARGCHHGGVGSATVVDSDGNSYTTSGFITVASDFDLKTLGRGYSDQSGPVKYLAFSKGLGAPVGSARRFAVLPPGALVLSAYVYKVHGPAAGTLKYVLRALDDTAPGSQLLAETAEEPASDELTWTPQLMWRVGTQSLRGRTIELSTQGTTAAVHWPFEAMLLYV